MAEEKLWFVYMVQTIKNKLYTGITVDIERRFEEHRSGIKGAKYFRTDTPMDIVYFEVCLNRSLASIRECEIKKMRRVQKEELIYSESISPSCSSMGMEGSN